MIFNLLISMIKIGLPTNPFNDLSKEFDKIIRAKADYVELTINSELRPDDKFIELLKKYKNKIRISTVHLEDLSNNKNYLKRLEDFLKIFKSLNIKPLLIQHFISESLNEDEKINLLKKINKLAIKYNSTLTIENTSEDIHLIKEILLKLDLGFTLDVGHANLLGDDNRPIDFIKQLGNKIKHLHFHDNFGGLTEADDLHLSIGEGKIRFKSLLRELKILGYQNRITLEVRKNFKENIKRIKDLLREVNYDGIASFIFTGTSVDGKISYKKDSSSKEWVKFIKPEINNLLKKYRSMVDVIMVGSNTVMLDNPSLITENNALRVIPDSNLKIPLNYNIFNKVSKTIIFASKKADQKKIKLIKSKGHKVFICGDKQVNIKEVFNILKNNNYKLIMIEGGGTLNWTLLKNRLIDKIVIIRFPWIVGGLKTPTIVDGDGLLSIDNKINLDLIMVKKYDDYILEEYNVL